MAQNRCILFLGFEVLTAVLLSWLLTGCLSYSWIPNIRAVCSSETSTDFCQTIRCHISEPNPLLRNMLATVIVSLLNWHYIVAITPTITLLIYHMPRCHRFTRRWALRLLMDCPDTLFVPYIMCYSLFCSKLPNQHFSGDGSQVLTAAERAPRHISFVNYTLELRLYRACNIISLWHRPLRKNQKLLDFIFNILWVGKFRSTGWF
jgi:hypothetical protein